jgi:hypothetical protein
MKDKKESHIEPVEMLDFPRCYTVLDTGIQMPHVPISVKIKEFDN